jgi:hypothetical protein
LPWEEKETLQKFEVFWEVLMFPRVESGFFDERVGEGMRIFLGIIVF